MPTEVVVPEFYLFFAETALQLGTRRARKKLEIYISLVLDDSLDADKLHRQGKGIYFREHIMDDSKEENVAGESFAKKTVKRESRSSVSLAVL